MSECTPGYSLPSLNFGKIETVNAVVGVEQGLWHKKIIIFCGTPLPKVESTTRNWYTKSTARSLQLPLDFVFDQLDSLKKRLPMCGKLYILQ